MYNFFEGYPLELFQKLPYIQSKIKDLYENCTGFSYEGFIDFDLRENPILLLYIEYQDLDIRAALKQLNDIYYWCARDENLETITDYLIIDIRVKDD